MKITRRRKIISWLLLIVIATPAGWLWYIRLRPPALTMVEVGTRLTGAEFDFIRPDVQARLAGVDFHISSRTIVVIPPEPGVVFSTVKKPGNPGQFAYMVLFRYGPRLRSLSPHLIRKRGFKSICTFDGTVGETTAEFEVNGKPIEVAYRIELNETRMAVARERLTIEGKYVDMRAGKVFLADLTAETPVYRQMNVKLPAIGSKLETREDAVCAAEAIRKSLENQDAEIKAFCRVPSIRLVTNLERTLILSSSSGDEVVDPNDKQIREALSGLDAGGDGVSWAILARSEMAYLQVSDNKKSGFVMEYQEGDVENHYRTERENLKLEEVVEAFANYRDGSIDWSVYGNWDRIKL